MTPVVARRLVENAVALVHSGTWTPLFASRVLCLAGFRVSPARVGAAARGGEGSAWLVDRLVRSAR